VVLCRYACPLPRIDRLQPRSAHDAPDLFAGNPKIAQFMGYFSIPIERLFLVDFQNRRQYGYFPLVFRLALLAVICRPADSKEFALFLDRQFGVHFCIAI